MDCRKRHKSFASNTPNYDHIPEYHKRHVFHPVRKLSTHNMRKHVLYGTVSRSGLVCEAQDSAFLSLFAAIDKAFVLAQHTRGA